MVCPYCKSPNEGGRTHCSACGGPLGSSDSGSGYNGGRGGTYSSDSYRNGKNPYAQKNLGDLKNPYAQKNLGDLKNPYSAPRNYDRNPYNSPNGYDTNPYDSNPYDTNPYYDGNDYGRGSYNGGYHTGPDNSRFTRRNGKYYGPDDYSRGYGAPPSGQRMNGQRNITDGPGLFNYNGVPMGWYYVLIYFLLFANAVVSFGYVLYYYFGWCFGQYSETWQKTYPQLHTVMLIYSGAALLIGIWSILTRFSLAHFSRLGPVMLNLLYIVKVVFPLSFLPVAFSVMGSEFNIGDAFGMTSVLTYIQSGFSLLVLICNIPYFLKRRKFFDK